MTSSSILLLLFIYFLLLLLLFTYVLVPNKYDASGKKGFGVVIVLCVGEANIKIVNNFWDFYSVRVCFSSSDLFAIFYGHDTNKPVFIGMPWPVKFDI